VFAPECVTDSVAVFDPELVGEKVTEKLVDAPGARVAPAASLNESENWLALDPERAVPLTVIAGSPVPPRLVTVTCWLAVCPTVVEENATEEGAAPSLFA
jgi:hypothetical protein